MLKYPCLVLDHDDTVVQSEATVNYPFFCEILDRFRPGTKITLAQYTSGCYQMGFVEMCRRNYAFTDQELAEEHAGWKAYVKDHIPAPYPGIRELILRQKEAGGYICVVSHSTEDIIRRDYETHFGILPDEIYGWDLPAHQRKPNPYPLHSILRKYQLPPTSLLVVDDMRPAWEMASPVGVPVAFAQWGRKDCPQIVAEMNQLCDFSFDDPKKLTQFLFK